MGLSQCIQVIKQRATQAGYSFRAVLTADGMQQNNIPSLYISFGQDGDRKISNRPPQKTVSLLFEYVLNTRTEDPLCEAIDACAALEAVLIQPRLCSEKDDLEGHAFDCIIEKSHCYIHDKYDDVGIAQLQIKIIYKP